MMCVTFRSMFEFRCAVIGQDEESGTSFKITTTQTTKVDADSLAAMTKSDGLASHTVECVCPSITDWLPRRLCAQMPVRARVCELVCVPRAASDS